MLHYKKKFTLLQIGVIKSLPYTHTIIFLGCSAMLPSAYVKVTAHTDTAHDVRKGQICKVNTRVSLYTV